MPPLKLIFNSNSSGCDPKAKFLETISQHWKPACTTTAFPIPSSTLSTLGCPPHIQKCHFPISIPPPFPTLCASLPALPQINFPGEAPVLLEQHTSIVHLL